MKIRQLFMKCYVGLGASHFYCNNRKKACYTPFHKWAERDFSTTVYPSNILLISVFKFMLIRFYSGIYMYLLLKACLSTFIF